MRYRELGATGLKVSELGFGAATVGDEYGKTEPAEVTRAVHFAIDHGINVFDVALYYGRTLAETRLGESLQGRRHEVVLATKCARYDVDGFDFSPAGVRQQVEGSLRRLKTDYVDILHVHDVEFGCKRQIVEQTIPTLRAIQQSGKARFIGITGLALKMLRELAAEAPVDCILSYCRYNLLNRDLDTELAPFAREQMIGLMNASPLHMRLLCESGPPAWHPAPAEVRSVAQRVVESCASRGVSAPRLAVQFAVRNPNVATTFVGISSVNEVRENLDAIEETPDPDLLQEIEAIVRPIRNTMWITGLAANH